MALIIVGIANLLQFIADSLQEICITEDTWVYVDLQGGCDIYRDSMLLKYKPINYDGGLRFPNAFTPNGDGRNDVFQPINADMVKVQDYSLKVVNRWGMFVADVDDVNIGWDGSFKGEQQPPGTYFYMATYTDESGASHKVKGDITLIR